MDPEANHIANAMLQLSSLECPFLALPLELRNEIYKYALDWPRFESFKRTQLEDVSYRKAISASAPLCMVPIPLVDKMTTPSILLVSRQVTSEALAILYKRPLVLSQTPPYLPQLAKPMDITDFISETTLQLVGRVVFKMDLNYTHDHQDISRAWLKTVETLLDIWCVRNNLEGVEVRGRYVPPSRALKWTFGKVCHHRNVMSLLSRVWILW